MPAEISSGKPAHEPHARPSPGHLLFAQLGVTNPSPNPASAANLDELLALYDYPLKHWLYLRTTSPIESTFATVRHLTKVTKGSGSRNAGLAMAFRQIGSAQARWRAVNALHLVAPVCAEAKFRKGKLIERPEESPAAKEQLAAAANLGSMTEEGASDLR
jgi:hypothetical protein